MPVTELTPGSWQAIAQEAGGTRVEARGTGFYITTDAAPIDNDFGTAIAVPSGGSVFVETGAAALFAHTSQNVISARVYTTGSISQTDVQC